MILLFAQLALAEPTAIDARGYWVSDTVSQFIVRHGFYIPLPQKGMTLVSCLIMPPVLWLKPCQMEMKPL